MSSESGTYHDESNVNSEIPNEKTEARAKKVRILISIAIVFLIVNVFLAAFQFRFSDQRWSLEGLYFVIGVLNLIYVCIEMVVMVIGLIAMFWCQSKNLNVYTVRIHFYTCFSFLP